MQDCPPFLPEPMIDPLCKQHGGILEGEASEHEFFVTLCSGKITLFPSDFPLAVLLLRAEVTSYRQLLLL